MSLERYFEWTCDYCGKVENKHDYGLPEGWVFIKKMGCVPHACPACRTRVIMADLTVHFMQFGYTACLLNGPPKIWPDHHKWTGDWKEVTCQTCLAGQDPVVTFEVSPDGKSITCKKCKLTSHCARDVENHYCGYCHVFHDELWPPARKAWLEVPLPPLQVRRYPYVTKPN